MLNKISRPDMSSVLVWLRLALLVVAMSPQVQADDASAQSSSASSVSKVGSFFKKFADDVKAGVKANTQGAQPVAVSPATDPVKIELPTLDDNTAFGKTTIVGVRLGITQAEAIKQVRQTNAELIAVPYWVSVRGGNAAHLRGAIGMPKPDKPDINWQRDEPHLKTGLEFTAGGKGGSDCLQAVRPGMPGFTAAQRNHTCERIWLQTTPDTGDTAKVVAISRTLIFGGDTQPAIEALVNDLKAKYGVPSRVFSNVPSPKGDLPTGMIWEFDVAGNIKTTSQAGPLGDAIGGWDSSPRPYTGGFDGRVNVIAGDEGPEFTRYVHVQHSPRQLTVFINPSATQPLLAGRLHVTLMDPGGVLKNHQLRVDAANQLIDEHNSRIDKTQQEAADRAAKNKPVL